ncbi:peptide deformylase [Orenia metallireducens]|uniref:Peptide deformylase n=1 Tax=Orenia metallireducens TaxID=1413210 RepID=A0A285FH20_9FIRM|nr:peptide deformylase [Orenia metallireducens]PRX33536.1 peptide deformylase [Orenia metallireducens]SNY10383.1 peptide deformylase [Orenia metallireducens]
MALLKIREIGDPVLRTKCKEVEEVTDKTRKLLDDMAETMYDAPGVGLAAPQVGISKRIVVIDVGSGILELINPEIIESSEKTYIDNEGCLSIPEKTAKVERAYKVKVEALDRDGKEIIVKGKGLLARALQHEIDHLDGKLFVDYL